MATLDVPGLQHHIKPNMLLHCGECNHVMMLVRKGVVQCENKHCPQSHVQFDVSMYAHARETLGA